ncbi:MAG TPA: hypothetical protein ENN66_08360 [Proteobacteria bacterium]|nr:hypothetical protein [Pseudomonadota bacterium]
MIPLPSNLVKAILAVHLAMETEELFAAFGEYMSKLFDIHRFSYFLFNNETRCYSLGYSTNIDAAYWDEIVFSENEAPFTILFDQDPLLFPTPMIWFGVRFDMYWAQRLTYHDETAAALVVHEFPENFEEHLLSIRFLLHHVTAAMVRATIYSEMRTNKEQQAARLELINEIGVMIGSESLEPLLATMMGMALKIMHAEVGSIMIYDADGRLKTEIEWGLNEKGLRSLYFMDETNTPYIEKISAGKKIFLETDLHQNQEIMMANSRYRINSIASFPLYTPYQHYGLLTIVNLDCSREIEEQKLETLRTISQLAAIKIENHQFRMKLADTLK